MSADLKILAAAAGAFALLAASLMTAANYLIDYTATKPKLASQSSMHLPALSKQRASKR